MRLLRKLPTAAAIAACSLFFAANSWANEITCNIDHTRGTKSAQLYGVRSDTLCAFRILFRNGGGSAQRVAGCTVAKGKTSCKVNVNSLNLPSGNWQPSEVYPTTEVPANHQQFGCVYADNYYPSGSVQSGGAMYRLYKDRLTPQQWEQHCRANGPDYCPTGYSISVSHRFMCLN